MKMELSDQRRLLNLASHAPKFALMGRLVVITRRAKMTA
jgi:hypothetical protein